MSRREEYKKEMGLTTEDEHKELNNSLQNELLRRQKKVQAKIKLETEFSYKLVKGISTLFDKFYLDGILGFVLPEIGDLITSIATIPFLYVSIFKIRSIRLTLSIMYYALLDILVGLIPFIGDFADLFHKSYAKSYRLIVGFVEDDPDIIREVNRSATKSFLFIILFLILIVLICLWAMKIYHGIFG
ncbi:MAG: DUF4112 domain-containing protein [Bacteroidales bacterium]|nr:DUF4112 domain-containing protein [Bacteroidales bacterium]